MTHEELKEKILKQLKKYKLKASTKKYFKYNYLGGEKVTFFLEKVFLASTTHTYSKNAKNDWDEHFIKIINCIIVIYKTIFKGYPSINKEIAKLSKNVLDINRQLEAGLNGYYYYHKEFSNVTDIQLLSMNISNAYFLFVSQQVLCDYDLKNIFKIILDWVDTQTIFDYVYNKRSPSERESLEYYTNKFTYVAFLELQKEISILFAKENMSTCEISWKNISHPHLPFDLNPKNYISPEEPIYESEDWNNFKRIVYKLSIMSLQNNSENCLFVEKNRYKVKWITPENKTGKIRNNEFKKTMAFLSAINELEIINLRQYSKSQLTELINRIIIIDFKIKSLSITNINRANTELKNKYIAIIKKVKL